MGRLQTVWIVFFSLFTFVGKGVAEEAEVWHFSAAPQLSVFSLSALDRTNGTSGTVKSNLNVGLDLEIGRDLEPLEIFLQLSAQRISIAGFSTASLADASEWLLSGRLGVGAHPFLDLGSRLSLGYGQLLVIRGVGQNSLTLDRVSAFHLQLNFNYLIGEWEKFQFNAEAGSTFYLPHSAAAFQFELGYDFYARIISAHEIATIPCFAALSVKYGHFRNSIVEQNPTEVSLNLGVHFGV